MSELGVPNLLCVPGLPGDFKPLDYDDADCDFKLPQRTPFSDLTNMSASAEKSESVHAVAKVSENKLIPMPSGSDMQVKSPPENPVSIECREEVVSMKELSDQNQNEMVHFLSPRSKASSKPSIHLPPVTPTKPVGEHLDPLTPTTNLKMLISAASPEIRNLEKRQQFEKKERLFHAMLAVTSDDLQTHQVEMKTTKSAVSPDPSEQENVKENSRKAKSLGLLCERFLEKYQDSGESNQEPLEMSLDVIAKDLNVERRRIYDIINVLESVEMVSRKAKNRYVWHGQRNLNETLKKLKFLGARYNYCEQLVKLKELEKNRVVGLRGGCSSVSVTESLPKPFNSEEEGKKEKSLGVMSQKFIMLFLQPLQSKIISLETAARVLYGELSLDITDNPKFKTKVRRLYDIANILGSLKLIRKVYVQEVRGRKPAFEWIGPDPDIEGFEPTNLHSLLTSQDKRSSFGEGEGGRRRVKRKQQKSGWVRHHSCNALHQGTPTETKAPLSLPSSPEKQPPTPVADSADFQTALEALCNKYPGQMKQFLTTPPAGSVSSPAIARKLLLPSPSPQPCGQEISPQPSSVPSLVPLNGGYVEGQQPLSLLEGTAAGTRSSKTIFVQRFVPVLTPNTILQMQAQASPPCGTITTAGNHISCMSIATSSNGLPVGDLPLITQKTGDSLFGTNLYPSSCISINSGLTTSPLADPTQGNKRSPDSIISGDCEYKAVMKQLKVSHQPGTLVSTTTSPSPPSTCDHSPKPESPLPYDHHQAFQLVSNEPIAPPSADKLNGWYDPISNTPSGHMTTKENKRSRKQMNRTKGRKVRSKGRSLKEQYEITAANGQDKNSIVEHVRRKQLPRVVSPNSAGSLVARVDETPPLSIQQKDLSKQKRRLFKAGKFKKTTKDKNKIKDNQVPQKPPREHLDHSGMDRSPSWSPGNTPTPLSSLKSSFSSQEFDQMLRNNVGSPLISFLPCQSQETSPPITSPCSLPKFTSNTQTCQLNILHSPTPLPPPTSVVTPINVAVVPSEPVPRETSYWPVMSLSIPMTIKSDTTHKVLPLMNQAATVCNSTANALRATAFQIVSQT